MKWTNSYRSFGLKTKRSTGLKTIEHKQAAYATILPSQQSTGGERHALPIPGLDPG